MCSQLGEEGSCVDKVCCCKGSQQLLEKTCPGFQRHGSCFYARWRQKDLLASSICCISADLDQTAGFKLCQSISHGAFSHLKRIGEY